MLRYLNGCPSRVRGAGLMPDPSISAGEVRISTIGCLARSVTDIALLLDVQAGAHPHDADSFGPERPFSEAVLSPPQSPRVAWLSDFGGAYAYEAGIPPLCEAAMRLMASKLNAIITPLTPTTPAASLWTAWTTLRSQKMAANYNALYDDPQKRALLKPEAVWEIEMGRALSENDVAHAKALRNEWLDEAARIFASHDFFLLPSAQVFPFDVSQAYPKSIGGTQMDTYHRWMEVSIPASLLGLPALAVPCGQAHGQHMGMQIVAKHGADGALLAFGRAYESAFAEAASISDRAPPPGFGIDEI
uniref:Amidase domain-containing protein n=1 Tax=Chrysotila carterae TaxID=13221 RepID=A0A7S4BEM0_CHRCT